MANSLDNLTRIAQASFMQALAESPEQYAQCCQVLDYPGGSARLMTANAGGLATEVTGATTSVAATDLTSGIKVVTQRAFALKHRMPRQQLPWLQETTAGDIGAQLANAAAANINKLYFDGLESLFALAHPMAGANNGQVGAGKKFIDTGLSFLQGQAGAGTQANLLTDALSETSLNAARELLRKYKNQQGLPLNLTDTAGRYALVVGPKNEKIARQLLGSQFTSSALQININQAFATPVVYPLASDDDDWFLIDTVMSPVGIWIGEPPMIEILPSEDNLFVNFVAQFSASFYTKAYEYGIIGSNVA
jgi:hypothetical protein